MFRVYSRLIASLMLLLIASPVSAAITVQNWAQAQNQTSGASPTISTSYTPTSAPNVVMAWCTSYNDNYGAGEAWTGATYGGVAMTAIATAEDTAGEEGEVRMFYLLSPSSGTQTVQCTHNGSWKSNIGSGKAVSVVVTSLTTDKTGFELSASGVEEEDQANPSVSFSGLSGTYRMMGGLYSGQGSPSNLSAGSGMTLNNSASNNSCGTGSCDVGARVFVTTYSSSDQTSATNNCAVTVGTDDVAMVCAVFAEVLATRKIFLIQ